MSKQRRGVIGVESSIVLIAFVIVAASLAFVVLNMGFTTTEKTKTTIIEGLSSSSSSLALSGSINGLMCIPSSTGCGPHSSFNMVSIPIKVGPGGDSVNLDNALTTISYSSNTIQFDDVYKGVVNANDDYIFVADKNNDRIQKFDENGNHQFTFDSGGGLNSPDGVAVDYAGNIYVADADNNEINIFDSSGTTIRSFGSGTLNHPEGIDIGPSGKIYVADTGNDLIRVYDAGGNLLSSLGAASLDTPTDVAVDKSENLYVTERGDDSVEVFDSNGDLLRTFGRGTLNNPEGIDVFGGKVYIGDSANNRIIVYLTGGSLDSSFNDGGNLDSPEGVEVDGEGNIYVADTGDNEIVVFDSSGTKIRTIGTAGFRDGQFAQPEDVAIQSYGRETASIIGLAAANNFLTSTLDTTYGATVSETSAIIYWPISTLSTNSVLDQGEHASLLIIFSVNDRPSTLDKFIVEIVSSSDSSLSIERQIPVISRGVTDLG